MKKTRSLLAFLLMVSLALPGAAQGPDPIKWTYSAVEKAPNEWELTARATIQSSWHLYSQNLPSQDGPIPTTFKWEPNDAYQAVGKVEEIGKVQKEFDKNFEMDVLYFTKTATFVQTVKLLKPISEIKGSVEFMACNDKMCLPPVEMPMTFKVKYLPIGTPASLPDQGSIQPQQPSSIWANTK